MSRLKNFTRSLMSSYAFLGVNILYTLGAVPLALHYLSRAEFGLWALTLQIAGYIGLIDLGMNSSVSRILIDHKDDRAGGRYGSTIQSGLWVGVVQGTIALMAGSILVWFLGGWLRVQPDLARTFFWLMFGQVVLTAATFATRMFNLMLYAWQRIDVTNYCGMSQLAVGFAVLWLGFHWGLGIFSLLAGAAASWFWGVVFNVVACWRLGLFPKAGEWGRPTRERFGELFNYGAEVLLIAIGTQLIISSQTVLVSRQLGLVAAGLWSVMTKAFMLVSQIVSKIVANAMPAFAEMHVRGEQERMWSRYHGLFITANVFAGVCAVLFAACNGPFVLLWTHGKFSCSPVDNVLLAFWLIMSTQQCCLNSLVMCLKEIRTLKYIFLIEGIVFIGVSLAVLPSGGITGMLVCSAAATTLFTWLSGMWRVAGLSRMGWKPLLWDWQKPLFWVLAAMIPVSLALGWVLRGLPDWLRLVASGGLLAAVGAWASIRYALPFDLTDEVVSKLPEPFQRLSAILIAITRRQSAHRA
jgi:O-antigen/teichoic acid export membrane protein